MFNQKSSLQISNGSGGRVKASVLQRQDNLDDRGREDSVDEEINDMLGILLCVFECQSNLRQSEIYNLDLSGAPYLESKS